MGRRGPLSTHRNEATPEPGPPAPPDSLDDAALLEWHAIVAELGPARVLTKADRAAMLLYCQVWAHTQDAARNLAKTGAVLKLPNGWPGASPYLRVYTDGVKLCLRLLAELGGTPASRARIPGPAGAPADDDDEIEV